MFYVPPPNFLIETAINTVYDTVLDRIEFSFSQIKNKYYNKNGETFFNPLHTAQWTIFLYEMARALKTPDICDKIYALNKMISSADIYYEVNMPDVWFCDHPQGSVMGRAIYGNFFSFSQGCTVGNNKGLYPIIGEHVSMLSNSKILGKCNVGDHVIMAANSYIIDQDIPAFSIVFGAKPNVVIKPISPEKFNNLSVFK